MIVNVKLYGSTWFNKINIPSSPSVLWDNFTPILKTQANLVQNKFLSKIRVKAKFTDIEDVDYVEITQASYPLGFAFYTVENIQMLSELTAELTLLIDPITTCGGLNWGTDPNCKIYPVYMLAQRMHITDDEYGKYTMPEDFVPSSPLEIEVSNQIGQTDSSEHISIILLTLLAKANETNSLNLPAISQTENKEVLLIPITNSAIKTAYYVGGKYITGTTGGAYQNFGVEINQVINRLRQYGVEKSILASYNVPSEYVDVDVEQDEMGLTHFISLYGQKKSYSVSGINLIKNVNNKKALIGEYNKLVLASNCSGEKLEVLPEDVSNDGTLQVTIVSDARFDGKPTCFFNNYKKYNNDSFIMQAVNGLQWANDPIQFLEKSGVALDRLNLQANLNFQKNKTMKQVGRNIGQGVVGIVGGAVSISSGDIGKGVEHILGGMGDLLNAQQLWEDYEEQKKYELDSFNRNNYYVAPDVNFALSSSVRDYKGNAFFVIKYKLSDLDLYNYDLYLTLFGYNVGSKEIVPQNLYNRKMFNYIQVLDVHFSSREVPMFLLKGCEMVLKAGVRLWHTKPTAIRADSNPIKGGV